MFEDLVEWMCVGGGVVCGGIQILLKEFWSFSAEFKNIPAILQRGTHRLLTLEKPHHPFRGDGLM